jgi:hypothetical protein
VDLGVVALTGDRRDATTSAGSLAGAIRRHVERLTRALDAHAQAADGHRQVSVDVRPLAPSEAGQDAAWVVENDDPGRTRRFTLRQMLQEVYSLTYLHALSLVYADGEAGGPRIAGLSAFDDLLAEVLLDRKAVSKVGKLIATQLRAIPDHRGTRVSFVEPPVAPGTGEPTVLRKRRDLVQSYRDKIVGGVILEVTQRRLRTASATLESVPL